MYGNENKRKTMINFENNNSTALINRCSFNAFNEKCLILHFCADSEFKIPDKSIAGDLNQAHFRLALSIQWLSPLAK